MSIDPVQLREFVIQPALQVIGLWSLAAEELVLGTACQESHCGRYLHQLGSGPACGIFQMEPATHDDLWYNFIKYRASDGLPVKVASLCADTRAEEMCWNLRYAAAMCRIHYYRVKAPLPASGDLDAQAAYWKQWYNTSKGAGTVEEYKGNWIKYSVG